MSFFLCSSIAPVWWSWSRLLRTSRKRTSRISGCNQSLNILIFSADTRQRTLFIQTMWGWRTTALELRFLGHLTSYWSSEYFLKLNLHPILLKKWSQGLVVGRWMSVSTRCFRKEQQDSHFFPIYCFVLGKVLALLGNGRTCVLFYVLRIFKRRYIQSWLKVSIPCAQIYAFLLCIGG
jgi:hypothetical protein